MPEGTIKEEIDAMLNIGSVTGTPSTEAVATDAPSTSSVATNAPSTNAPGTSAPSTTAPATTAPATAAPEDDELKKIKEENERLRQQIEESSGTKAPKTTAPATAAPIDEIDFLGNTDLDELTRDSKSFNALLNKVHKSGIEAGRKLQETTLRGIPDIVKSNVTIQSTLKKKVEEFYKDNEDLMKFKKAVSTVYEELASEHPDWKIDKIFEETEKESRKRLELYKKSTSTTAPTTKAPKGPRFPKTKSSRERQKPQASSLLNEIDEMNKDM